MSWRILMWAATVFTGACDADTDAALGSDAAAVLDTGTMDVRPPVERTITWVEVQPVYAKHCGACHGGASFGGTNFATVYADAIGTSRACRPDFRVRKTLSVAACGVARIDSGSMPPGGTAVDEADLDIMREFVFDGLLEQ